MTVYLRADLSEVTGECFEIPYRAFDLVEFIKKVQEKQEILALIIDPNDHNISFISRLTSAKRTVEE